ncbi:MAG: hypothetical protein JSS49_10920 [Planctomycetes bacterium]|nr:hypothetical protein [Planctomycetota bacterium]
MSVRNFLFLTLTATLLMVRSAAAQTEARIQLVQTGIADLKSDLEYLVELSPNPALRKAFKATIEPLIDSFAEGVDPSKPIRVDVVIGKDLTYESHFPISVFDNKKMPNFLDNLKGMGYEVIPKGGNLFDFGQAQRRGVPPKILGAMRYANGYASFAPDAARVPANMPEPTVAIQGLLDKKYDIVGSMKNSGAAADIAARKANFQQLRKQLEAGVSFKRNEDKNEFALRKLSLSQNLNEAERFIVDTDELLFGWSTIAATKETPGKGRAEFSIAALPGTDLFKSTQVLAAKPSYFANVKLNADSAISGRLNFAIDPLRVGHLKDFYTTVRPIVDSQIDKRATIKDADQKKAAKEAAGILIGMCQDALQLATADLFLDLRPAGGGKHTLVCGVRVANGKKADELVKLLPRVNAGREVKLDLQKIGEHVSLHSVAVPERRLAAFQKLFPGENLIYVATSNDAVWGAAGVNAVAELTTAISQAAEPAPEAVDPRVVFFTAHAGRLVELVDIVRPEPQKIDEKLSKDEQARLKRQEKDLETIRQLAMSATANCDAIFSGEVKKVDDKVVGSMDVSECVLKFVGSAIAEFSKAFN